MGHRILLVLFFCFCFVVCFQTYRGKGFFDIECPTSARANNSNLEVVLPSLNISLKANLEIFAGSSVQGTPQQTLELTTSFVPKQLGRANTPQLVHISTAQLRNLTPGIYTFRVNLLRQSDALLIAQLQNTLDIRSGSSVNFDQSIWNYDFDTDGDNYNNLTEIMNGGFIIHQGQSIWVSSPTDPENISSHPEKISLLRPNAISVMSPDRNGRILILGDPFAMQSGVLVKGQLLSSNGIVKNSAQSFSRFDGSFDLVFSEGATVGDRVVIYAVSRKDQIENPDFDSSRSVVGPGSKVELQVEDIRRCQ